MGSPDRLIRIYQDAQPASVAQIDGFLHPKPSRQDKPSHETDSNPSPRELVNGALGGRRAERIREGIDSRSRNEGRGRPVGGANLRPRAGTIYLYHPDEDGFFASKGTEGRIMENPQRHVLRKPRGDISLQNRGGR